MRKLRIQHSKLEQARVRLQERDRTLFGACTFALQKKNKARATMCANELAEVRNLVKILSQIQIAIERIILRLETVKELSTIMIDLKPALSTLKNITSNIVNIMPDIASELDNVNDSIQETLNVTKLSSEPPTILTNPKTPEGQEILQEVNTYLEQKVSEQLPEPPMPETPQQTAQPEQKLREIVALVVGGPESQESKPDETFEPLLAAKDLKVQSVSFEETDSKHLEDKVFEYIKERKGLINATDCALKLKIPPKQVEKILEELYAKGRIVLGT